MVCTECNEVIPFYEEDATILVVYSDGRGMKQHCHHNPFDENDPAITAILGSQDCVNRWIEKQLQQAQTH